MGLGFLEDTKLEHVPGIGSLADIERVRHGPEVDARPAVDTSALRHTKDGSLVLVPQPSDSPNDPYNWSRIKKELFCLAYAYGCGDIGIVGPMPNPALVQASQVPCFSFSFQRGCQWR